MANRIDRSQKYVASLVAPGIFEKIHYLMGMEEAMIAFYEEPECMHELVEFLTEYELSAAREVIDHIHPDAICHHDDWGSQISSFLSPEMSDAFFTQAYKRIYGFWKDNGVELVIHHSDSYAANLVPQMIECGIDIWQGILSTNDIPHLIQKYGGKITFHGGIDNGKIDREDWSKEKVEKEVAQVLESCGKKYFIPGMTAGNPVSFYPGVYEAVTGAIHEWNQNS